MVRAMTVRNLQSLMGCRLLRKSFEMVGNIYFLSVFSDDRTGSKVDGIFPSVMFHLWLKMGPWFSVSKFESLTNTSIRTQTSHGCLVTRENKRNAQQ